MMVKPTWATTRADSRVFPLNMRLKSPWCLYQPTLVFRVGNRNPELKSDRRTCRRPRARRISSSDHDILTACVLSGWYRGRPASRSGTAIVISSRLYSRVAWTRDRAETRRRIQAPASAQIALKTEREETSIARVLHATLDHHRPAPDSFGVLRVQRSFTVAAPAELVKNISASTQGLGKPLRSAAASSLPQQRIGLPQTRINDP